MSIATKIGLAVLMILIVFIIMFSGIDFDFEVIKAGKEACKEKGLKLDFIKTDTHTFYCKNETSPYANWETK